MAFLPRREHCDNKIRVKDDFERKSIRCPNCDEVARVRGTRPPDDGEEDRRKKPRRPSRKQKSGATALRIGLGAGGVALAFTAVVIAAIVLSSHRRTADVPKLDSPPPFVPKRNPTALPELSAARPIQAGFLFQEAVLQPASVPMKVWFYSPEQARGQLPLVLVPPAGSNLITGMNLGDGDRAYHEPYVRAGFAVGSFEIDGHVPDGASDALMHKSAREFREARAGLVNAKAALDYLLAKAPDLGPNRVFIAGHSSAATLVLLFAAHDPRGKGCISYCDVSDFEQHLARALPQLERAIPGYRDFPRISSPKTHVEKLTCPVFLFHAQDDGVVPVAHTTTFAALLKSTNRDVTVNTTARGDHYQSMINEGIP